MSVPGGRVRDHARRRATDARSGRPHLLESLRTALLAGALVSAGLVLLEVAVIWDAGHHGSVAYPIVAWLYLASGARAWYRRPASRVGALIMQGGAAMLVSGLVFTDLPVLVSVGLFGTTWILSVIVHLLLAFPTGRLHGRVTRAVVVLAYINSLALQGPPRLLGPEAAALTLGVQRTLGVVVMTATALILLSRLRRATGPQRRTLIPLYGYGMVVAGLIPFSTIVLGGLFGLSPDAVSTIQVVAIAGVPFAFTAGTLLGAFAPTAEAEELAMWLASGPHRTPLVDALRRALGDPTVTVAYWLPERDTHVDEAGTPITLPPPSSRGRASVPVDVVDHRVGAITYDPGAVDTRAAQEAAQVIALAIDADHLTAQLKAREADLRGSRARIVAAGDRVRERIARDLHDGLQGRLVLLGIEAQRIAHAADAHPELAQRATALRRDIDAAATELRHISHQVMPSAVVQHGLAGAVEDLTVRMPMDTAFQVDQVPDELTPAFALTAYFTVAEGLANAVKHSGCTAAEVSIRQEGPTLVVEVTDDGIGGASDRAGTGLTGLRDRVDAIGGRLLLDSPVGAGTRLRVEVPCVS